MKTINVKLGKLFGYEMVLRDVPIERVVHIEKLSREHLGKMNACYLEKILGDTAEEYFNTLKSL